MKPIAIICALMAFTLLSKAQMLTVSRYTSTTVYKDWSEIKKGRGQKVIGVLIIIGGAAIGTLGAKLAVESIQESIDPYDYYQDYSWKDGSAFFLLGIGTIAVGIDKIKEGRGRVRDGKVSLRLSSNAVGLVVNF